MKEDLMKKMPLFLFLILLLSYSQILCTEIQTESQELMDFISQKRILDDNTTCVNSTDTSVITEKITFFGTKTSIPGDRCTQLIVRSLNRPTAISLTSNSIKHMIITDKLITECQEANFLSCPDNSTLCINSINRVEALTQTSVGVCLDQFYIYTYIQCVQLNNGDVQLKFPLNLNNQPKGCDNIADTNGVVCAQLNNNPNQCGVNSGTDTSKCNKNCYWLSCVAEYQDGEPEEIFGSCVSTDSVDIEIMNSICMHSFDFKTAFDDQTITTSVEPNWCGGVAPKSFLDSIQQQASGLSWWQAMFVVLGFVLFIFLMTMCWYRYKITRYNVAPFTPPHWCPEAIYPRVGFLTNTITPNYAQEFANFDSNDKETDQYQPPS